MKCLLPFFSLSASCLSSCWLLARCGLFCLVMAGCSGAGEYAEGKLLRLLSTSSDQVLHQEALEGGAAHATYKEAVHTEGLVLRKDPAGILMVLEQDTAYIQFIPSWLDLPETWGEYDALRIDLMAAKTAFSLQVEARIYGPRNYLPGLIKLLPARQETLMLPLEDLPLTAGSYPLYIPKYIRLYIYGKAGDKVLLERLALRKEKPGRARTVVDPFGQRLHATWEGKVTSEEILKAVASTGQYQEHAMHPQQTDAYGGMVQWGKFEATGFFRVANVQVGGREAWWFITPDGHPFWSFGVTGVRAIYPKTAVTPIQGRTFLYESLPDPKGPYQEVYIDSTISFYALNTLKIWGSRENWHQATLKRLKAWGFNTLGNWSSEQLLAVSHIPYTRTFRTHEVPDSLLHRDKTPDFFHPAWAHHVDTLMASATAFQREKLLVGYFVDNEQHWGNLSLLKNAGPASYTRRHWLHMLQHQYPSLEALNQSWDSQYTSWDEIYQMEAFQGNLPDRFEQDYIALETAFAGQYFKTIASTLKKYDPNHLYLGCRFTKKIKPAHIVAMAGKYSDVITVNVYDYAPNAENMDAWHSLSGGKPILIGEHHTPLLSARQLPPHYKAFTAAERKAYFVNYVKTWAQKPYALGSHWYQYTDQELTGRVGNGENQIIGLVDITDQPHRELVEAAMEISRNLFEWHAHTPQ